MNFKVKTIPISTGTVPIIVMNRAECAEMDIHLNERVRLINLKNKKELIVAVDFYEKKDIRALLKKIGFKKIIISETLSNQDWLIVAEKKC